MSDTILTELKKGDKAIVVGFAGGSASIKRLNAMGISEGKLIQKISGVRLGGPIILLIDRAQVALGCGIARTIIVKRVENDRD